jgi:DNA mismatch repair protein MutL
MDEMGRIRVLADQVANKIAAGEVVERPASVVKELLENSLDAGSTELRVDVESGGRRLIRVADNGCGMLRDDALLAFERHATSKLRSVSDLESIATLGFRGEALPSIASVSRLLLETRSPEETTGTLVEIAGGKLQRCDEVALAGGTTITVRDLFFNVPARKKFLRTEQTELAHIASMVTHYSLANFDKMFRLVSGNNELLHVTPAESTRERVFQVFGGNALDELVDLGVCERECQISGDEPGTAVYRLSGFVSRPQVQKASRTSIYIFVNGRLIRDRLLMHALSSAYHNLMPPGCFPFALLFLECDFGEVDVNVHPSKTEVRFRQGSFAHDFLRDSIRARLLEARPAPAFSPGAMPQPAAKLPYSEFSQMVEEQAMEQAAAALPDFALAGAPEPERRLDFSAPPLEVPREMLESRLAAAPVAVSRLRMPDTHSGFPTDVPLDSPGSLTELADLRPLGQLHDSFVIAAGRDGLWIIDQHVAHERVLFERVLRQRASGTVEMQHLLMPIVVQLTPGQQVEYARIADELNATGFECEPFGQRTIAIKGAPAGVGAAEIEKLVFEILENTEAESRGMSIEDVRRNIAASIACHAAIKINTPLERGKVEWLLQALSATEYPMSCPHGRPVALRYSTREILKAFHRI